MVNYIVNVSVDGQTVNFYVAIAGESWTAVLKNVSTGAVEASKTAFGDAATVKHSLTATTEGLHRIELTCNWSIANPCSTYDVNITAISSSGIVLLAGLAVGAYLLYEFVLKGDEKG